VIVTHGYEAVMVRWLQQHGLQAQAFVTEYGDDTIEADASAAVTADEGSTVNAPSPDETST
jgi:putative mRNA 3-end processing factor